MPTTAFRLISIEAKSHRKAARQKELQINHSTTILSSRIKSDNQLNVEIRYSVSYGLLGMVQLDCEVIYSDENKNTIKYTTFAMVFVALWVSCDGNALVL